MFHQLFTNTDKGNMFSCEQAQYKRGTKQLLKGGLRSHQQIVFEGHKYFCMVCEYQATTKFTLIQHQAAVHAEKKFPCYSCDYQANYRVNLIIHK